MCMNDMANLILILSCIHVHVGIYVILVMLYRVLFCWPLGSGVAFYSSGFGRHDHQIKYFGEKVSCCRLTLSTFCFNE